MTAPPTRPLRLVFVNWTHPGHPHVSALRLPGFARALARQGHRVVLLTGTLHAEDASPSASSVRQALLRHDWRDPLALAAAPLRRWLPERIRNPRTPPPLRRLLIGWSYLRGLGLLADWSDGTRRLWPALATGFAPDLVWGTFGNIDSWIVARGIAHLARCPWVMDVKDGWDPFIPPLLRAPLARRFQDASAMTANSELCASRCRPWLARRAHIVYSGIGDEWKRHDRGPAERDFRITLVGSVYGRDRLAAWVAALSDWLDGLSASSRARVILCYAGTDRALVEEVTAALPCPREIYSYLPHDTLADLCRRSAVNAYLWLCSTFHHKLLELLACERPLVSFPGECAESVRLAAALGGDLRICQDRPALAATLAELHASHCAKAGTAFQDFNKFNFESCTWDAMAQILLQVFGEILQDCRGAHGDA